MKQIKAARRKNAGIAHSTKIVILNWLLKGRPEAVSDPKILKNELRLLNKLLKRYPDQSFWLSLRLPLDLTSLCYFTSQSGGKHIEEKWRFFQFEKAQKKGKNPLDSISNFPMLAEDLSFVDESNTVAPPVVEPPRPKTNILEWADS